MSHVWVASVDSGSSVWKWFRVTKSLVALSRIHPHGLTSCIITWWWVLLRIGVTTQVVEKPKNGILARTLQKQGILDAQKYKPGSEIDHQIEFYNAVQLTWPASPVGATTASAWSSIELRWYWPSSRTNSIATIWLRTLVTWWLAFSLLYGSPLRILIV